MKMDLLGELRTLGWYLSEAGLKKVSPPNNKCNDVNEIIKLCLDIDFREIAEGALSARRGETLKGPIVLQLQWARNIAAPKISETSSAPRMLCLELSDGQSSIKALEVDKVPGLDLKLPPGTKIRFKAEQLQLLGGYLLLRNQDLQVLGGHVAALEEKWEVAKSMQLYAKNGRRASGITGPPPWVAFGKSLDAVTENAGLSKERNFKSLQIATEKEKENKDNEEFNAMRNEAIAEAAKAGTKKIFGGGGQQILDYNIKKILDKGYSEEEARQFLRTTNNNLERALYNLKRRQESKQNENGSKTSGGNTRMAAPSRDVGSRRAASKGADDAIPTKPIGNVSLFDFLTDKLPANASKPATGNEMQNNTTNKQSTPQPQTVSSYQDAKTATYHTHGSSQQQQQQRQSEPKSARYSESRENRQQGGRYSKPDLPYESNRKDRFSSGAGGASSGGNGPNYSNRQNGRGNRNAYDNSDNANKRSADFERGSRKPTVNNNSNQNSEVNANMQSNSSQQSMGKTRGDNQNSRSTTHRNQYQNRNHQQQQYANAPPQKQSYSQRQRSQATSQPVSTTSSNMNMAVSSGANTVSNLSAVTNMAPTTLLPNGFTYDPSKIIGFQSKEANEYAMNLMRSHQGKSTGAEVIVPPTTHPLQQQQKPPIQFLPQPPPPLPAPIAAAVPVPVPVAATAPMPPPHHFGMTTGVPTDAWNWKIGDLCMAKYWEDGQYYEAEITGICDKTCVVCYIGYNNHEEVLKTDCLPITDANHRPINNYNLQQAMQVPPPQQQAHQQQQQHMRSAMRYYVPPHKRNH